jgi:hypothetical protein
MIFPASQIVGLIEIETADDAGSECLVALGCEEQSLGELLVWLTGTMARPTLGDDAVQSSAATGLTNRIAGLTATGPVSLLPADLERLATDLIDAAARFRQSLTVVAAQ